MYNVKITPQYYIGILGNKTSTHFAVDADQNTLSFENEEEAQKWIDAAESDLNDDRGIYMLSHGEYAKPEYEIVESGVFKKLEVDVAEFEGNREKVIALADIPEKIRTIIEDGKCGVENEDWQDDCVVFSHTETEEESGDIYRVAFCIDILEVTANIDDLGNIDWSRPKYFVERY